ncbi:MAG: STAS domain-containing protein [Oscillospiraceae bacterium]|jgi:anti-anti-sigma factor|nr:STAS domain-containing protein [Oscillospiraceae bacterium]
MNISTAYASGRLTIYLGGELDHHAARETMQSITELLDEYLPRECALDFSGLRFMDSSGVALIVRVSRRMRELGGRVWIENPAGQTRRVLEAAGVERLVQVAAIGGKT